MVAITHTRVSTGVTLPTVLTFHKFNLFISVWRRHRRPRWCWSWRHWPCWRQTPGNNDPGDINISDINTGDNVPSDVNLGNINGDLDDIDPANVDPANINPADIDPANIDPDNIDPANIDPANIDPATNICGTKILNPGSSGPATETGNLIHANINRSYFFILVTGTELLQ